MSICAVSCQLGSQAFPTFDVHTPSASTFPKHVGREQNDGDRKGDGRFVSPIENEVGVGRKAHRADSQKGTQAGEVARYQEGSRDDLHRRSLQRH